MDELGQQRVTAGHYILNFFGSNYTLSKTPWSDQECLAYNSPEHNHGATEAKH